MWVREQRTGGRRTDATLTPARFVKAMIEARRRSTRQRLRAEGPPPGVQRRGPLRLVKGALHRSGCGPNRCLARSGLRPGEWPRSRQLPRPEGHARAGRRFPLSRVSRVSSSAVEIRGIRRSGVGATPRALSRRDPCHWSRSDQTTVEPDSYRTRSWMQQARVRDLRCLPPVLLR